jgi:vacuolar-type H+-ATPase subunit C/Vma6
VEKRIRRRAVHRIRIPLPYLRGAAAALLDWLSRRVELDNLVTLLRGLHAGLSPARIRGDLVPLAEASALDLGALADLGSITRLRDRLAEIPSARRYARALEDACDEYDRHKSTFPLENALQLVFWRRVLDLLDRLPRSDRTDAGPLVHMLIDGENLIRAYRLRVFFELPPEQIMSYLTPRPGQVGVQTLQQAASGQPIGVILRSAWIDLPGTEQLQELSAREATVELELVLRRHRHRRAVQALAARPIGMAGILAYALVVEDEARDVIAALESNDRGLAAEEVRPLLTSLGEAP